MARYKWKLLVGKHAEGKRDTLKIYVKGDIIETDKDLSKFNGPYPNMHKFELVEDNGAGSESTLVTNPSKGTSLSGSDPVAVAAAAKAGYDTINAQQSKPPTQNFDDTLEAMTEAELKKFAEAEEIDLGTAKGKKDILKAIKASMATA